MIKAILLLTGAISLISSSYALPTRDQAARTFGHRLDSLNEQNQNNNEDGQNSADDQNDQQGNDENYPTQEQNNNVNQNHEGNEITPEQQLSDLLEDMKSVMLHIDRLNRKIAKLEEVSVAHKKVANDKKTPKKKDKKQKKKNK